MRSAVPTTVWSGPQFSAGEYGSRYIKRFVGDRHFTFPKSLYATELSLASVLANKRDALVIDFFSGSGTTAHAVMRLNHQDGGNRRCVCITNNEVSEDEAKKLIKRGLRQGDQEWESLGICEHITKPRVTAAITGKTPEGQAVKGNYKFVDEFPMVDGFEENALFFDLTYEDPDAVELRPPSNRLHRSYGCAQAQRAASSNTKHWIMRLPIATPYSSTTRVLATLSMRSPQ